MSLRLEFVTFAMQEASNIRELCRRYGISPKTGYKWIKRFQAQGPAGLKDQSRRPLHSPTQSPKPIVHAIVALRQKHPAWGGRKLKRRLQDQGLQPLPSPSTITEVLRRHALLDPKASLQHTPSQRFERPRPNELLQMDYKGHFPLARGGRCHPLTLLDDHSRFLLGLFATANEQDQTVRSCLIQVFRYYGLPEAILCDNGAPWGAQGAPKEFSAFEVWLMRLGVRLYHGRPLHPQTQGKCERLHRTLKSELLSRTDWLDLSQAQKGFEAWRQRYNHERPHEALQQAVPASRYQPSVRAYPETLPNIAYDLGDVVRQVKSKGEITFHNRFFYIGRAFIGLPIALRPSAADGVWEVFFSWKQLGQVDLRQAPDKLKGRYHPIR